MVRSMAPTSMPASCNFELHKRLGGVARKCNHRLHSFHERVGARSPPYSTYNAPGVLPQGPGDGAESPPVTSHSLRTLTTDDEQHFAAVAASLAARVAD